MEIKLCKCGCGEEIKPKKHHSYKPAYWISGHNTIANIKGKGKGWRINHGYKQHTFRGENIWKYEHVLVMEKHIGRRLRKGEVVHHINHDKLDNRLENLELTTISKHMTLHNAERRRNHKGRFLCGFQTA